MKQSLLAFLAMAVFSLLALSQQRVMMQHHSVVYGRDAELAAMNFVSEKLAYLQTKSFDEVDELISGINQRKTTEGLTPASSFGLDPDEQDSDTEDGVPLSQDIDDIASDIDDYHGYSTIEVYTYNRTPYRFQWSIDVKYVNPEDSQLRESGTPTLAKLVTLTLKEDLPESYYNGDTELDLGRAPIFVELSRIFSPGGMTLH